MRDLTRQGLALIVGISLSAACAASAAEPTESDAPSAGKVLVLPFTALNKSEFQPWLGRSIEQSIVADLTPVAPERLLADEHEASDAAAATDAGKKLGARYVVFGSFATADNEVRITGQLLDLGSNKTIGALKATGPTADVFRLEDQLARQIKAQLSLDPEPREQKDHPPVAEIPAFAPVRAQPQSSVDPYVEAYGSVQAPQTAYGSQYNSYYYGTNDGLGSFGLGLALLGGGGGCGFSSGFGCGGSGGGNTSTRWNGSFAAGIATSGSGTPLGGGFGVNVEGASLRSRGGTGSSGMHAGGAAGAHHAGGGARH